MRLPCRGPIPLMRVWYTHTHTHSSHEPCVHVHAHMHPERGGGAPDPLELRDFGLHMACRTQGALHATLGENISFFLENSHCKVIGFSLTVAPTYLCYKTNLVPITPFMLHSPGRPPPRRALPSCASRRCPKSCPGAPWIHVLNISTYTHTYTYTCAIPLARFRVNCLG